MMRNMDRKTSRLLRALALAAVIAIPAIFAAPTQAELGLVRVPEPLNVRQGPDIDTPRLTVLRTGQQVRILEKAGGGLWYRVADTNGTVLGFVTAHLLTPGGTSGGASAGAQDSIFAQQLARLQGGTTGLATASPQVPAPTPQSGSIFEQIASTGAIEAAHEENRRRDAERLRQQEAEQRREAERWRQEREEAERLAQEEEDAREEERRYQEAQRRAQQSGGQDPIATIMLGQMRAMQQDLQAEIQRKHGQLESQKQAQALAETRRVQEQQRQLQQPQQAAPTRPTASPPRPVAGPSTSAMPRQQRQLGCWATPEPPHTTCVRSSARWGQGLNRDRFIVTHENICSERIVVKMCNERSGAQPLCGQNAILPGRSITWYSFEDSSGGFSVHWVGSRNSIEDWSCVSTIGWRN